ncbi:MAG: SDR family NAD(P)-dependent oxidoreductase, partial [bacterium]
MIAIDLTGKTAIITGSSQGLGLETAKRLHAAGANIIVNYFLDESGRQQQQAESVVKTLGCRAIPFAA